MIAGREERSGSRNKGECVPYSDAPPKSSHPPPPRDWAGPRVGDVKQVRPVHYKRLPRHQRKISLTKDPRSVDLSVGIRVEHCRFRGTQHERRRCCGSSSSRAGGVPSGQEEPEQEGPGRGSGRRAG
eukprot:796369-Prorocentrum_minimum.AAC.2